MSTASAKALRTMTKTSLNMSEILRKFTPDLWQSQGRKPSFSSHIIPLDLWPRQDICRAPEKCDTL
ncbi:hypothetical protein DPMN_017474, partial [Dreissena polymorpha]